MTPKTDSTHEIRPWGTVARPVITWGPVEILPVLHGVMEFAAVVRQVMLDREFAHVAVELPPTLRDPVLEAVKRLPTLSVVHYPSSCRRQPEVPEEVDEDVDDVPDSFPPQVYLLAEPTCALMEAIRTGLGQGLEVHFIDRDTDDYERTADPLPDPYTLTRIGPNAYLSACLRWARTAPPADLRDPDRLREVTMAYHLQRLRRRVEAGGGPDRKVLCVCGLAHAVSVRSLLEQEQVQPLGRVRRTVHLSHLDEESSRQVASEPAYLRHAYEEWRRSAGAEAEAAEAAEEAEATEAAEAAAAEAAEEAEATEATKAAEEAKATEATKAEEEAEEEEEAEATEATKAAEETEDEEEAEEEEEVEGKKPDPPDRLECLTDLYLKARDAMVEDGLQRIETSALNVGFRFARNWALLEGRFTPDLYQTVVAARSIADDDFAYHVWALATDSAAQGFHDGLPTIQLSLEDLDRSSRIFRFHRRLRQRRHRLRRVVRRRPKERYPGEWKKFWEPFGICSYPPEDLVIESYGSFLQKKARSILSEEMVRTEPFTVSLGDGIDIRQTIRNWHEKRIFVKFQQSVRGKVGAVCVILDPDDDVDERYPWKITWQGEHTQESDMAFYATTAGERLAGPGVSRCEYGGFLMTYPPGRMFDVWEDPFFEQARTKSERLMLAALDYCVEPIIVYVAEQPPAVRIKELARRLGKKLIYIPVGNLSPVALKQIRVFHVLAGRHVRDYAKDYLK